MIDDYSITTADELRALFDAPSEMVQRKVIKRLDRHCRTLIAACPFVCVSTSNAAGRADISPRGDAPGFVQVIDDATLFVPDRPGNNRIDSMANILENPNVGLYFIIPGMDETLRIYGKAELTRDPALLDRAAVNGRTPKIGIKVAVEGAHLHCGKAFKRSRLWDPAARIDRKTLPSLGQMVRDQLRITEQTVEAVDAAIEESYRKLY
ncbi:MAG: pyridoxamine 5'-phosphate oxidase family protein [Candidatus Eiseniibacteriota bacterium]